MSDFTLQCTTCHYITKINRFHFYARRKTGLPFICKGCGGDLCEIGKTPKTGKTDSQKRSRCQEKKAAKRIGGHVQPASGAGQAKGDIRLIGVTRMECKLTRAKSFTLKLEDLKKIESETGPNEDPAFEIEFQSVYPPQRYVVLPGWLYDHFQNIRSRMEQT